MVVADSSRRRDKRLKLIRKRSKLMSLRRARLAVPLAQINPATPITSLLEIRIDRSLASFSAMRILLVRVLPTTRLDRLIENYNLITGETNAEESAPKKPQEQNGKNVVQKDVPAAGVGGGKHEH